MATCGHEIMLVTTRVRHATSVEIRMEFVIIYTNRNAVLQVVITNDGSYENNTCQNMARPIMRYDSGPGSS